MKDTVALALIECTKREFITKQNTTGIHNKERSQTTKRNF